ncbi:MAG: zinc-ribbon domain-containing protein [Deltaproteobacteria bacterium]|nr:zinc-ribbon domain-containing protein [Kofleriaceae bacterium]
MRIECEQCRALVDPTWTVTGAELLARCPACGHDSRATASSASAASGADGGTDADGVECPKCGLRPVTGDACARCGLTVERMATWAAADTASDALAAAWEDCIARWDDPAKHDRAASLALTLGEQPWLARKYRAVLRDRPGDAIAAARLARTGKIAQAAMLATASAPRPGGYRRGSFLALLLVFVLLIVGGLLWGLYMAQKRQAADPASPSSASPPKRAPTGVYRPIQSGRIPARTPALR